MDKTLGIYLEHCEKLHGHICAGQILGIRMALLGCQMIDVEEPAGKDRKKIIVWVEIDRCMADAVAAVTGARLGKRTLKYFDYGKVAATFYNVETERAVRIAALDESREIADRLFSSIENRRERQMSAYQIMEDKDLFKSEVVIVNYDKTDAPGRPLSRVKCGKCHEGINDSREVVVGEGDVRCRACAYGGYYNNVKPDDSIRVR